MMKIEIFNVELGQCAMAHCPNGLKLLLDAGHNVSQNWRPSEHFYGQDIERLILSNADEDHASDFGGVLDACRVREIWRNGSLTSAALGAIKPVNEMGPGIRRFHQYLQNCETLGGAPIVSRDLGGVQVSHYTNRYGDFTDTNNLSLVTFLSYSGVTIFFAGDLEIAGIKKLLENSNFVSDLKKTDILIAPHHGRAGSCCAEMFADWTPQTIILSDAYLQHATQETVNWWGYRVKEPGCLTVANERRKVFTTRSDGDIHITVDNGRWGISTDHERRTILGVGQFVAEKSRPKALSI